MTDCVVVDFEAQIRDLQQKRKNVGVNDGPVENRVGLGQEGVYDSDIYEGTAGISRFEGYLDSIPATDDQEVSCLCCLFVSFKSFALVSCCRHFHMCIPVSARKFFLHIFVT